jgi:tetratricopeptide (TPR) repeat protein
MASEFLSYVREDEAQARSVAAQLERAGHSVWWDRQIKGGAQYSTEIEAALNAADKVVVLWSAHSVGSAWVRDEAAAGRDTGRLVPVKIDGTEPPLGFRQFQTIDLSKGRGRAGSPQLQELLNSLGPSVEREPASVENRAKPQPKPIRSREFPRKLIVPAVAAALVAAGAAAWLLWPTGAAGTPVIAIVPADGSAQAHQAAHDLSIHIAGLPGSDSASFRLSDADYAQPSPGALTLKVNSATNGPTPLRELTLLSRDGAILWSTSLEQPSAQSDDLTQQAAIQAQRAMSCAGEALSYRREPIDQPTLKTYVAGCTTFDNAYGANTVTPALEGQFEQVIAKAPHFEPAWAKLFAVDADQFLALYDFEASRRKIRAHVERAGSLGIDVGELYAAKVLLLRGNDFTGILRTYDQGIARHPDNALLYRLRGERWSFVGRMNEAVADTSRATQLDPLSPANQQSLASELAYSGQVESGYEQLRKAEQLWPHAMAIIGARFRLDLRFGDPNEALALYRQYIAPNGSNPAEEIFIEARIDPTPQKIEAALDAERRINRQNPEFISSLIQALAYFGRKDEALDLLLHYPAGEMVGYNTEVLFRPMMREMWRDPRSIAAAAHIGLVHYWKSSGNWPDFCFDPTLPYDCKKEAAKYPA